MKKFLFLFLLCFTSGMVAQADTITLDAASDDIYYLGTISGAEPSKENNEVIYINTLINIPLPSNYTRTGNYLPPPPLPKAIYNPGDRYKDEDLEVTKENDVQVNKIDVSDWTYVYAKYGKDAFVWYVADIEGVVDVSGSMLGSDGKTHELSHLSMYKSAPSVPEPATMLLLGSGLLGLALFGRKFTK